LALLYYFFLYKINGTKAKKKNPEEKTIGYCMSF